MIVATCLVGCTFAAAQLPKPQLQSQGPRLAQGQELLYSGSFAEEIRKQKSTISRRFLIENRILTLEALPTGAKIALFTIIQPDKTKDHPIQPDARTVSLELAQADLKGRLMTEQGERLDIPIGGPAKIEGGAFVELPSDGLESQKEWVIPEAGRPRHYWRKTGVESVDGQLCYKLIGAQQSDDWDHPNAGKTAWRRLDTVWLSPRTGFALRYERIMEQREPTSTEPTYRSTTRFHLETNLVYPGQLFRDREAEINLYRQYSHLAEACLQEPSLDSPRRLESLSAKISYHCETQPPTPYREALQQLQRRLESASRGELPPVGRSAAHSEIRAAAAQSLANGAAPDFVASDLATNAPIRLQLLRGQPVLMVFYNPNSPSAREILRFAQTINQTSQVHVLGLSVARESAGALQQRKDMGVEFPIAAGADLRSGYGVDATPKIIVIDADCLVRRTFEGWVDETPVLIGEELKRWGQPERNVGKEP
jgi:peroxiredoxin